MTKTIKWILGIVIALVVIGFVVGTVYMVLHRGVGVSWMLDHRSERFWRDRDFMPHRFAPGMPGVRVPFARAWFFFPLQMITGGVIWLGLLVLIILGIISLARGLRRPAPPALHPMPPQPVSCPNCSRAVQGDWSHCPYCGNPLHEAEIKA